MKRTKTSRAWMNEHVNDPYVQQAKLQGWRARAAFKLIEIDEQYKLLHTGMRIVDLGSAPGSWSQVAAKRTQSASISPNVFALDLLSMEPIEGVHFIQGDFTELDVLEKLTLALQKEQVELVLSDIAPNISGIASIDQAKMLYLAELALDFACQSLTPQGKFLIKLFQGSAFTQFQKQMQQHFCKLNLLKPKASRSRSAELYLLGQGLRK